MAHPTDNKSLSQKIIWHLQIFGGAVFISLIFSLILRHKIIHSGLPAMLVLTFAQLEIFIWLGTWFFQSIKSDHPRFIRKMIARLLLFYLTVLAISFVMFVAIFSYHFIENGAHYSLFFKSLFLLNTELKTFFTATAVGFGFGALFFFYAQWTEALRYVQKLKEEKLIFQYETLKSQVNPHFLFNSLNSLSSLIKSDPDLSEEFVIKLSSVYRYILENSEKELVPLATELEFVENYFALQKIRDGEKISLKIEILDSEKIFVLPVSLQLLVENALKHNSATRINPLEIIVHNEGIDKLAVRNNVQTKMQLNKSSKIGLKNLNERSRLILNRGIEVLETNEEFVVKIPVKAD
jgi:sensor histidine kinase YesM